MDQVPPDSVAGRELREDAGRNQDIPLRSLQSQPSILVSVVGCPFRCNKNTPGGRNIVITFDGTSNQFGEDNSNVVEFYSRIKRTNGQRLYYNSGIGTLPAPTSSPRKVVGKWLDLAFAHSFGKRVCAAYRWLADIYEFGDRIFIYGFSRGAYQARTLAAMIDKVGLILQGNEEQIPFAYQVYRESEKGEGRRASRFKQAFSRDVWIHFLGAWDTVSSIGLVREQRPGTNKVCNKVCYFRHAVASDECRVKFQPELVCGGASIPTAEQEVDHAGVPRTKEVYFPGSHSDIGGGNVKNLELNNASIALQWMVNQSAFAGLLVEPSKVVWDMEKLKQMRPTNSMTFPYRVIEVFPFTQLTYKNATEMALKRHKGKGRVIMPGQTIHASVCFVGEGYVPKATFHPDFPIRDWEKIVGVGNLDNIAWAEDIKEILEMDLFDVQEIPRVIRNYMEGPEPDPKEWSERLEFVASIREGAESILKAGGISDVLRKMVETNEKRTCTIIRALVRHDPDTQKSLISLPNLVEVIVQLAQQGDVAREEWFALVLWDLTSKYGELPLSFLHTFQNPSGGDGEWQTMVQSQWFRQAILATLYFGRSLSPKGPQGLGKVEELLRGILKLNSTPTSLTDSRRANIRNSLATALQTQGTILALQQAVEIRISLVDQYPDEYHLDLAYTLLHYSTLAINEQCGENIEPPPVTSTRSRSTLIKDKNLELAKCLTNLANRFYDLKRHGDAYDTAAKSVALFRQVIGNNADLDIATSLNNFSNRLSDEGRYEEALGAIEEAVRMRRALAIRDPVAYRPQVDLATSLTNLSRRHRALGNREGSLKASEEADKICRGLSAGDHEELDGILASSLLTLSIAQSGLGKLEDALDSSLEALRLNESRVSERPAVFNADLASSLNNLSNCHSALGQHEDALAAIKRSVELREILAKERPAAFNADLAMSLFHLSLCYSNLDHLGDALKPAQDSLNLYRDLARDRPAVYNKDVVDGYVLVSRCLSALGRKDEAQGAREEARMFMQDDEEGRVRTSGSERG